MEIDKQRFDRLLSGLGNVYARGCPEGPSELRTECLIEGLDPNVEVAVRFRQPVARQVLDSADEPVAELAVTGRRYVSGEESVEREVQIQSLPNRTASIKTAGSERADLVEGADRAGAVVWSWEPSHATVEAWTEELEPGLRRVRVEVANRLQCDADDRERALMRALQSTYVVLHTADGAFVSLADPPPHLREHAAACRNEGLWPVPVGEAGDRRTMLAAPIVLEDYPQLDPHRVQAALL